MKTQKNITRIKFKRFLTTPEVEKKYLQKILESREHPTTLRTMVRDSISKLDFTNLYGVFDEYLNRLKKLPEETKFKKFHLELIQSPKTRQGVTNTKRIISVVLEVLVLEALGKNNSYIERNAVAQKIGLKLLPKTKSEYEHVQMTLSLGLNLIQFAVLANLCQVVRHKNKFNPHSTYVLLINEGLVGEKLQDKAREIRANSVMVSKPLSHGYKEVGGRLNTPRTMLRYNKSISTQSNENALALNILQSSVFNIRRNLGNNFLKNYKKHDRWYNDNHQLMVGEIHKLKLDLRKAGVSTGERHPLWFPVAQDHRGRVYYDSSYITPQGDSYQKGMLEWHHKEKLTPTGVKYLKIAITNEIYTDKISFEQAIAWFDTNVDKLPKMVKDHPIAEGLYRDYINGIKGLPVGSITHFDATNNGGQIFSLWVKDLKAAWLTNIGITDVSNINVQDLYGIAAKEINKLLGREVFTRGLLKKALFSLSYGASMRTVMSKLEDKKNGIKKGLFEFFPANYSIEEAWDILNQALKAIAPSMLEARDIIFLYQNPNRTKYEWVMPDGFRVEIIPTVTQDIVGHYLDFKGQSHQGSVKTTIEMANKRDRSLLAHLIHATDAWIMRMTIKIFNGLLKSKGVPAYLRNIVTIHDCYGIFPNHAELLFYAYKKANCIALETNILVYMLRQIDSDLTERLLDKEILMFGSLTTKEIMNSKYALR